MSTSWYSVSFSAIPPNNYSVSYYFSVASGLVTGIYRYDNIGVNILAPQTLFGGNSGSDNVFTVGTSSFSITQGTNIYDPLLYNNVVSGNPTATNYFNFFSATGTTGRAGIYYWNNTGTSGGYIIARATVTAYASPNITSISSPPTPTYNINNTNLLYYYPFNMDYLDYKTGAGVSNVTTTNVTISTTTTKLTNGSILFPGSTGVNQLVQIPSTTFTTNGVTIAFWAKITLQSGVSPQFLFDFASGAAVNTVGVWLSGTGAFQLMLYNSSSVGNSYGLNYTLPDANWHHYCVTTSQTSGVWSFYVDGSSIAVSITAYPTTAAMTTPYIGANHLGNANMNGNMNQFLVFNRVLTSNEIGLCAKYPAQIRVSSASSSNLPTEIPTYLAIGTYSSNQTKLVYSFDLANWKNVNASSLFVGGGLCIANDGHRFVAGKGVGNNGVSLLYSNDGLNWVASNNGGQLLSTRCRCVKYANGMFVAGGIGTYNLVYSYNGINWSACTNPNLLIEVGALAYGNGTWIAGSLAGGASTNRISYSYDGITWYLSSDTILNAAVNGLTYGSGGFVAVGANSAFTTKIAYSTNGISWTASSGALGAYGISVTWSGTKYYAVGAVGSGNGVFCSSTDGITWATSNPTVFSKIQNAVYWTGSSIVVGQDSSGGVFDTIVTSVDGTTWSNTTSNEFSSTTTPAVYGIDSLYIYPCFLEGTRILRLDPITDVESYVPV